MHWQCLFRCLAPKKSWPLLFLRSLLLLFGGSPDDSAVKNPPADAGDVGGVGSIPGLERSNQEGMATHSSILAGKVTQTEEPGGLRFMGSQRVRQDWVTEHSTECYCLVRLTPWRLRITAPSSPSLDKWQMQRNSLSCLALHFSI